VSRPAIPASSRPTPNRRRPASGRERQRRNSQFHLSTSPEQITQNIGTIIIDEDFAAHGYGPAELGLSQFSDAALRDHPVNHGADDDDSGPDPFHLGNFYSQGHATFAPSLVNDDRAGRAC
jgi:hypothetical protein